MCSLLPPALAPPTQGLSQADALARGTELAAWLNQYPANPSGDPASTYWKPPGKQQAAGGKAGGVADEGDAVVDAATVGGGAAAAAVPSPTSKPFAMS